MSEELGRRFSDEEIERIVEAVRQAIDSSWNKAISEEAGKGNRVAQELFAREFVGEA